jgi:WD40 repeat protein
MVSASRDDALRLWDAESGRCVATLSGHQDYVRGCAWSPDGHCIVSSSFDGTLRTWDADTGFELAPTIYHLTTPHGGPTWCSADFVNNRIVACGAEAWRCLGWVVPEEGTGLPEWLPADSFGPLPAHTEMV